MSSPESRILNPDSLLKWGIMGTGMIAKKFATDLPQSETGRLGAVSSRTQESADRFAAEFGGRGIAGYDALLADPEIDAVYLALPNGLHREVAIAAMRAGKHVLCEKPIALDLADAEAMFAAADETGKTLCEAFMYRAHRQTEKLIELVQSGVLGDLKLIRTDFTFDRPVTDGDARYRPDQGGGAIMDVGCYCTNFTRALAGAEPIESTAVAHLINGVDDYAAGTLKFENGDLLATFTCGMTVVSDQSAHIAGTKARIEVTRFWQGLEGFTIIRPDAEPEHISVEETRPIYAVEADAFAAVVRGEGGLFGDREDTLGNMCVMDDLRKSAGVVMPGQGAS